MSIRYKLLIAFSVIVLFATAVAVYGMHLVSNSSTLVVRLYDGPMMAPRTRSADAVCGGPPRHGTRADSARRGATFEHVAAR